MFDFFLKPRKATQDRAILASVSPPTLENSELTSYKPIFCKIGHLIDLSLERTCEVIIEHAGEPDMSHHFREALSAAMEDLLQHRANCPTCSRRFAAALTMYEDSESSGHPSINDLPSTGGS